jgi:hypothetical protein
VSIYYATEIPSVPVGGVKQIFRHAQVLAEAGWDCLVLGLSGSKAPGWLTSRLPVSTVRRTRVRRLGDGLARVRRRLRPGRDDLDPLAELDDPTGVEILHEGQSRSVPLRSTDVLVLPEYLGMSLRRPRVDCRTVIFNQNVHYMFRGLKPGGSLDGCLCADESVPSIVVSQHNYECLRYAFPAREIHLTRNGIDGRHFFFEPTTMKKKQQIAYMPRKLPNDLAHVLAMLELRGCLAGWKLCPIDGAPEPEAARIMRESRVFLSSCSIEGFGLPPLEALLCGCVVVGYTGMAAGEFLNPSTGFPIAQEDRLAFSRRVETLLAELSADPEAYLGRAAEIAARLRDAYSLERERGAILGAWRRLAPDHDPDRAR